MELYVWNTYWSYINCSSMRGFKVNRRNDLFGKRGEQMKQTRLIDANGLMNLLERELDMNGITDWGKGYMEAIHDSMEHVKFMPTIEADTVKHGSWFLLDECANAGVYCSVCHKKVYKTDYANQKIKSKYCPNCGAVMDLDGE